MVDLAHALGWAHLHVRKSIGKGKKWTTTTNVAGWPDLFLWHPKRGFAGIELKVGRDKATSEQEAVLTELAAAGARVMIVWPEGLAQVRALLAA